jgi:translocation and assembly module TamB
MSRRRLVVLASAATLIGIFTVAVLSVALLTRTDYGRERLRDFALGRLKSAVHGTLYVGRVGGSIIGDITIDTLELRDERDSVFFAAGGIEVGYDPRDLLDRRIALSRLRMRNALVKIDFDSTGTPSFRRIFPPGPPGPQRAGRGWGDYIVVRDGEVQGVNIQVSLPWSPADSLRGARRDSAIAHELAREDRDVRRVGKSFVHVMRWTDGRVVIDSARLDDKDPRGRFLAVRNLDLIGSDPPLHLREVQGGLRLLGDTLFADVPRFGLPGSRGSAAGRIWWGNDDPVRFDLAIVGDTVSLADINWVYPTLPRTGGGRMKLAIRSQRDPRVIDYVITDMDVRSMDSWLRGRMTFGIGAPITILKDVDLVAQPVDFRLIETLSGEPLPYPFRGTLTGTLKARGGPLNRFYVDATDIVYRDANVPGAITVGRGQGELDILKPSETVFHGFALTIDQADLRTVQILNPSFPRLDGIIAGRATLDSSLLDLRFRGADLSHSLGNTPVSRMIGAGRITFGEATHYDVALNALPLSFTTLRQAYREGRIPLRGEFAGPVRLQGTLQDLAVITELRGPSGTVAFDGRVDGDSVGGYGAHGNFRFAQLDLRSFLDTAITPPTILNGLADLDVDGDSLATLRGSATIELERSLVDSIRIYPSRTRVRFADRRVRMDTLDVQTALGTMSARGALGLAPEVTDSLRFVVAADSLGALRQYFRPEVMSENGDAPEVDSLKATVSGTGVLYGSVDTLAVRTAVNLQNVDAAGVKARIIRVAGDLKDVLRKPVGEASVNGDTIALGGIRLLNAGANLRLRTPTSGEFSALATAANGPVVASSGTLAFAGDTTTARIDSLGLSMQEHRLLLRRPAAVRVARGRVTIDTVELAGDNGEEMRFAADIPPDGSGELGAILRADSLHVADLAQLAQVPVPLGGVLVANVVARGTRDAPVIAVRGTVSSGNVGQVNFARLNLSGDYADRRMRVDLRLIQQDSVIAVVTGNVPLDLALASRSRRLLNDTLRVSMRSNDIDLRLIEGFTPNITRAGGRFSANLDLAGPARTAVLTGNLGVTNGGAHLPRAGITLRGVQVRVVARNDSVFLERVYGVSGPDADDFLSIEGFVARPLHNDASFDLTLNAHEFHAINNRKLAELFISFSPRLQLRGSMAGATLTGTVVVVRGSVYMPEQTDKQLISLDLEDLAGLDTVTARRLQLLPKAPPRLLQNLRVQGVQVVMGPDVWVRSATSREINIKLGGAVQVTVGGLGAGTRPAQLALDGSLATERGTYLLNLGIVQTPFTIESGALRFFGDADFNPALDINAIRTVRQVSATYGGRNDIRIRVHITGTLLEPRLELTSADSLNISGSDLISYLVFGAPSLEVGGGLRPQLVSVGLSSFINAQASQFAGGLFDYVQVQTAADQLGIGSRAQLNAATFLKGAQLGFGKQINSKTFVSLSAGLCQLTQLSSTSAQRSDPVSLASSIGAKVEYQVKPAIGISAGVEPSLSALLCQGSGFTSSPRQYGFDLFKTFRW